MAAPEASEKKGQTISILRDVFARNVTAALSKKGLTVNAEVERQAKRMGLKIQASTVARAKEGSHSPTLDTVEVLAQVTGYDPWQLLTDTFDPSNPQSSAKSPRPKKSFTGGF